MSRQIKIGDRVVLERLPQSVRADDPGDDIFRQSLGQELVVVSIEKNGNLELDVRGRAGAVVSIFVPADCVR